jgi:hypothetical protein
MMRPTRMVKQMIPATTKYLKNGANDDASMFQSVAKAPEKRKRLVKRNRSNVANHEVPGR